MDSHRKARAAYYRATDAVTLSDIHRPRNKEADSDERDQEST